MSFVYKIVPSELWRNAVAIGRFEGAAIDLSDGYIHLSTASQVRETARLHFKGQDDLLIVAVNGERLGNALRYEASRGGQLFPHLYAKLDVRLAEHVWPLARDESGAFIFPAALPEHDDALPGDHA